jgi:putative endonuclease
MNRRQAGRVWEKRASAFLRRRGVKTLEMGYQCRFGEIDLVCVDERTLVIVEVRARGGGIARALESVDTRKRRKLIRTARHLLMQRPEWSERPVRFDVIAIENIDSAQARYEWIKDAFDAESAS